MIPEYDYGKFSIVSGLGVIPVTGDEVLALIYDRKLARWLVISPLDLAGSVPSQLR